MSASSTATAIFDFGLGLLPAEAHPYLLPARELIEGGIDKALAVASANPTLLALLIKLAKQLVADLETKHVKVTAGEHAAVTFTVLAPKHPDDT